MSEGMLVLYGSETGNARELAEYLHRECIFRDISVRLCEMNQISVQELQSVSLVILAKFAGLTQLILSYFDPFLTIQL